MKNFNYYPYKKPIFLIIYFGSLAAFLVFSFNFYDLHKSRQKITPSVDIAKTVEIPNTQSPQALISNFYSVFSKTPSARDHLVKQYSTAKFQKKYYQSVINKTNLITCGGEYTQSFNLSEGYLGADKKMVYPVNLQYEPTNTQSTVGVQIAENNHKYLIDDVICPSADVHVIPKKNK